MTDRRRIIMLTSVGIAALTAACSTPSTNSQAQKVELPPGSIGRLDTTTQRSLAYTLREDDLVNVVDTHFVMELGSGQIKLPLEPFYGPDGAGQFGVWNVDGSGHAADIAGSSMPGLLSRLDSMPNGPIYIGQTWEIVTPSDAQAMSASAIVMQIKRQLRVAEAFDTPQGVAVRVELDGWHRLAQNSTLTNFKNESGVGELWPTWTARLNGVIDVHLATGTLLGMRIYDDLMADVASPDDLPGTTSFGTYCIDPSTGFSGRDDICGWNQ
jgi:hypothetical protein